MSKLLISTFKFTNDNQGPGSMLQRPLLRYADVGQYIVYEGSLLYPLNHTGDLFSQRFNLLNDHVITASSASLGVVPKRKEVTQRMELASKREVKGQKLVQR